MASHKTFFGKLFGWIGDLFHNANQDFLQTAVNVTQAIKTALDNGAVDIATILIPGTVDDEIVKALREKLPIILADELALQGLTADATDADVQALMSKIVDSFGGLDDDKKEEFYTSVAANIYKELQKVKAGEKITFGEAAALVESMYQQYLQSKA